MFADGGAKPAQTAKHLRSLGRTKRARDFLLDFHHAQIPFGKVIVEGSQGILSKAKNVRFEVPQSLQEQCFLGLFDASFSGCPLWALVVRG